MSRVSARGRRRSNTRHGCTDHARSLADGTPRTTRVEPRASASGPERRARRQRADQTSHPGTRAREAACPPHHAPASSFFLPDATSPPLASRSLHGPHLASARSAYFITFHTYGTWLPGRPRVAPWMPTTASVGAAGRAASRQQPARGPSLALPVELHPEERTIVLRTIEEVCRHRGWILRAAHVRVNHVHAVTRAARVRSLTRAVPPHGAEVQRSAPIVTRNLLVLFIDRVRQARAWSTPLAINRSSIVEQLPDL